MTTDQAIVENGIGETPEEPEQSFSDEEGYIDTISDQDLIGDIIREEPQEREAEESCIIVDQIPIVGPDRLPKLKTVLNKIFQKFGEIKSELYPVGDEGNSLGYCFVEYGSRENAREAQSVLDGHKLDAKHTFAVNLFTDLEDLTEHPDNEWSEPEKEQYKDLGNFKWWLENEQCLDQYLVQSGQDGDKGDSYEIFVNDPHDPDPKCVIQRNVRLYAHLNWSSTMLLWSPNGTYVGSYHERGVLIWGGEKFEIAQRIGHPDVISMDFSPSEKYLVTYSNPKSKWEPCPDALRVYDTVTGELKRKFPPPDHHLQQGWPLLRWSPDDSFFAMAKSNGFSVYETENFTLHEKKSVKVEELKDMAWSPSDNMIAYYSGEVKEIPAKVAILKFTGDKRIDVRSKNLFTVANASLHWQQSGDHLAVQVERYGKKKKNKDNQGNEYSNLVYQIEIFQMRGKDIPVDSIEIKQKIMNFAWEPKGTKFAVASGTMLRTIVTFYKVAGKGSGIVALTTMDNLRFGISHILFAPAGGWCVLANLNPQSSQGGQMLFVDTNTAGRGDEKDVTIMNDKAEHGGATQAEWDPTGRYLTTFISTWDGKSVDLGFRLWNFQGRELMRRLIPKFAQFQWRPRPKSILPEAKRKEVKKNLKDYSRKFELIDERMKNRASKDVLEKRQTLMKDFLARRAEHQARFKSEFDERLNLRKGIETDRIPGEGDPDEEMDEETIELPLTRKEVILEKVPEE